LNQTTAEHKTVMLKQMILNSFCDQKDRCYCFTAVTHKSSQARLTCSSTLW